MKGLMVSLIIVFFAGMTNIVLAAGQQAEQDAAEFEPRLGLQPMAAPRFERPGPDDSDDDDAWPTLASSQSRESTNTSSLGDRQFGAPTPESGGSNIRFDVKVDRNAIDLLKQGRKVFSPVQVLDQSTKEAMHPEVVSDIALFLDANAGKDLQGVELNPQPMEAGSRTLRFEIQEQQLDRIEKDAFLFKVPNNLRGQFDRVEFVAVSGPTGSHEFSSGLSSGPRGSALGFGDTNDTNRFGVTPTNRFSGANENPRWNTESPQPGVAPGEREFMGPVINSVVESQRNRVAPLETERSFGQASGIARTPLNTGGQFRLAEREQNVEPARGPFGRTWERPESNQRTPGQNTVGQNRDTRPQNTIGQPRPGQRFQETAAERRVRALEQQLAEEKASKASLQQDASDLFQKASLYAQQRDTLNSQLRAASEREPVTRPVSTRPVDYQQRYATARDYQGRPIDAAGNLIEPFGTKRENFQTREPVYTRPTATELAQEEKIAKLEKDNYELFRDKQEAERWANTQRELLQRSSPADEQFQLTPVRVAAANNIDGQPKRPRTVDLTPEQRRQQEAEASLAANGGSTDVATQELDASKKRASDLFWLLPLLLGSLALNFFLWLHSRTLYLRYDELADELRGMVGGSTI